MLYEKAAAVAVAAAAAGFAAYIRHTQQRKKQVRVVITGGSGNLGTKLAVHLLKTPECYDVVLLEHPDYYAADRTPAGASVVLGDLRDGSGSWTTALDGADAVVHFSAVNPYPNADFNESAGSMLHAFNVFLEATRRGVRRGGRRGHLHKRRP